jgi:tetratricopeptide (TPR) repeat protein/transglutaminase-like putative cysteine protease
MLAHLVWLPAAVASVALSQAPPGPAEPAPDYVVYERLAYRDRVESDGTQTRVIDARALLRNATAVSALGQLQWPYVDTFGEVTFEDVVIQKTDGRTVEVKDGLLEDVNPFGITGTPIAADVRFKKLTIPGLEPGDRLSYRLVHRQKPLARGCAFGEMKLSPALGDPLQTYEIDLPRSSGIRVRLREGIGARWEDVPAPADRLVHRLSLKVPRPSPDDFKTLTKMKLQEWAEPDVIFTSFGSWNEVAEWWWGLSRERLQPDASVRTQAESLSAPGPTPRQRLERLHAFVAGSIRYLNVNFGMGRMQPRPAPQVLANRYGDCKDKHALLAALAASMGIDVRPVLIDSSRPDLRDDVPAPQQFDHMVSVARLGPEPESWLWLDGTDRFGVPGYLAPSLRDKRALLVEPSGEAQIVRTPVDPPFVARTEVELKATLLEDGALRGREMWRFRSDEEVQLRAILEAVPEAQRSDVVKASLARTWADAKVTNVVISDLSAVAEPLRIEFDAERPAPSGFATGDRSLWIPLPPFGLPEADEAAPLDADKLEFGIREFSIRAEVEIPPGLSARAPLSVSVERPFGKFASVYAVQGTRLTLSRTLRLTTSSLGREEAGSYNGFRRSIGSDRDQKFLVLGAPSTAAATMPAALHGEGLAAFERKDYWKAVELLRKATEGDPKIKDGFLDLGRALNAAGRYEDAVAAFTKQAEISPFHESAYAWRAHALERLGRGEEAEKYLLKQIEVAPFEAWAYNDLADRRTGQQRFREAADLYSRAVAIEPKAKGRWVDLGWAEARGGRPAEARAALAQARSLDLPDWMKISAGGAYLLAGDAAAAAEMASAGLATMVPPLAARSADGFGENDLWGAEYLARGWYLLGSAALEKGDQASAERYLDAAWHVWFLPDAAWALGNLREKQGRLDEAVVFWSMAADVPTADLNLPADRQSRIEAACRRLPTAQPQAPQAGTKGGGSARVSEAVTVSRPSRQLEAQQRLMELRTIALNGPVLADLTEEVLLLTGPDGSVERVRNLSRRDAGAFDRQLAKLGSIRLSLTSPDGRSFKAVRRGLLACSRATSCVIILDLPGLASSAEARPATADEWSPPEHPDPGTIRREADADARAGHFELALKKYQWFHRNALQLQPSLSGVRLSFALSAWFELGGVYPPALAALRDTRDQALETFKVEHTRDAFFDFAAINRTLGEEARTVAAFVALDMDDPAMARQVFAAARTALLKSKDYALCGKYLKPKEDLSRALDRYRMQKDEAKAEPTVPEIGKFAEDAFTNETTTLIALLVVNGREGEAKEIATAVKSEWDAPAFHAAVDKAMEGVVPEPWP